MIYLCSSSLTRHPDNMNLHVKNMKAAYHVSRMNITCVLVRWALT
jgi:hypothetical protein